MKATRYFDEQVLRKRPYIQLLRVVTLEDGETIHNAFFDRNFREVPP